MSLTDALRDGSSLGRLARGLQLVLVGLVAYGAAVGNWALVLNAVLAIPIVFVPELLGRRYDHEVDGRLAVWIAVAAVVHVGGFLGPYQAQTGLWSWYDQAAHAISASFVAGVGYATILALDRSSSRVRFPAEFRFVFTVCFILAFGVAWEIIEFGAGGLTAWFGGGEGALVQYGKDDIVLDLAFNTVAAALVALFGSQYFRDIAAIVSGRILGPGAR